MFFLSVVLRTNLLMGPGGFCTFVLTDPMTLSWRSCRFEPLRAYRADWGRFAEMKTKLDALRMEFPHDQEIARAGAKVAVNISNPSSGTFTHMGGKVGRNEPCPCGSGKKVKRCCGRLSKLH